MACEPVDESVWPITMAMASKWPLILIVLCLQVLITDKMSNFNLFTSMIGDGHLLLCTIMMESLQTASKSKSQDQIVVNIDAIVP